VSKTGLADVAEATIPNKKRHTETCPKCGAVQDRSGNRFEFTRLIRDALDVTGIQAGSVHRALAKLQVPFWISGAYDDLLEKSLGGRVNTVYRGFDTLVTLTDRPTIVRLTGDVKRPTSLRVLQVDYEEPLRVDRQFAIYLLDQLQGKVVLFAGFDPNSPDFGLLLEHVINGHLAGANVRAFLLWPRPGADHEWNKHTVHPIRQESLDFVTQLSSKANLPAP
jgi:hypothetical protein